jgi:hypothetical protein
MEFHSHDLQRLAEGLVRKPDSDFRRHSSSSCFEHPVGTTDRQSSWEKAAGPRNSLPGEVWAEVWVMSRNSKGCVNSRSGAVDRRYDHGAKNGDNTHRHQPASAAARPDHSCRNCRVSALAVARFGPLEPRVQVRILGAQPAKPL